MRRFVDGFNNLTLCYTTPARFGMADGRYGGKEDWTIGVKELEPDRPPRTDPSATLR
jgi:hypothetical protein